MTPRWLLRSSIEILHNEGLAEHGGLVGFRDEGLLDSALARPQNLHHYGEGDLFELAGEYAFGIVRNHPFLDGNKRAGFLAATTFLLINGWLLDADEADATVMTWGLAAGEVDRTGYSAWLRDNCHRVEA